MFYGSWGGCSLSILLIVLNSLITPNLGFSKITSNKNRNLKCSAQVKPNEKIYIETTSKFFFIIIIILAGGKCGNEKFKSTQTS